MSEEDKSEKHTSKRPNRTSREKTDKPLSSKNTLTFEDATLKVREWASHLSAETRNVSWLNNGYVMPDEVFGLCRKLVSEKGALYALIGYQGIGKTSAILAIANHFQKSQSATPKQKSDAPKTILFKWRRPSELIPDLLTRNDAFASLLKNAFLDSLRDPCKKKLSDLESYLKHFRGRGGSTHIQAQTDILGRILSFDFSDVEREFGKSLVERLRYQSFLQALGLARVILIDLPDYSKTDMRRVSSDLEAIYWIWNELTRLPNPPNIVISFQKEMFRGHYFLGKMNRIDLKPLKPEKLVEAYRKQFPNTKILAEDALLLLAKMSRGVFRRFLRYITFALDQQERTGTSLPITVDQVREAIPPQVLTQDMDQQLTEIFPRQPDMRTEAVRLLLHLEEHGSTTQTKITELLDLPDYTVSRLIKKLEDYRYIKREKKGIENIIALETP